MSKEGKSRSQTWLAASNIAEAVLPFLRAVLLSHLMPKEEFGLALTISIVFGLVEMATDLGISTQSARIPRSDAPARATLHSLALLRGCLIAIGFFLVMTQIDVLQQKTAAWSSFALVSVALAIRPFSNLSVKQLIKDFDFRRDSMTSIAAQIVWTVVAVAVSAWTHDHRGMSAGLVAYALTLALMSNLLASDAYKLAWKWPVVADAWRYSLPLIPNGVLIAIPALGDRLVVGAFAGLEAVAVYGPLVTIAMMPKGIIHRYAGALAFSSFLRCLDTGQHLVEAYRAWSAVLALCTLAVAVGMVALADPFISATFGPSFSPGQSLTELAGLICVPRMLLGLLGPLAFARGDTANVTLASAASAISILPGLLALSATGSLVVFLATMVAVEIVTMVIYFVFVEREDPELRRQTFLTIASTVGAAAIATVLLHFTPYSSYWLRILICALVCLAYAALFRKDLLLAATHMLRRAPA